MSRRTVSAITSLGAAALAAWILCPVPPRHPFTSARAALTMAMYLSEIAFACAAGAYAVDRKAAIPSLLAIAIWFAPAGILLGSGSTAAVLSALVISAALWWLGRPVTPPDLAYANGMFGMPHTIRLMRQLPISIGLAMLAELIVALAGSGEAWLALLIALAGAVVFWRTRNWAGPDCPLTAITTMIAVLLTISAMARFVRFSSGGASATGMAQKAPAAAERDTGYGNGNGLDGFTGVILIPEVQKHVMLVPPLPAMSSELFRKPDDHPLDIPFYGVYWFYRFPATRPPTNAVTMRGTPDKILFRSQGRVTLQMEAHQNLGKLIDVSCCSLIQLALRNAEHSREPIRVQLILGDSTASGVVAETVGMQEVDGSETQTLDFPIRPEFHLLHFDEITVRFHRGWTVQQRSARIAIDRFVLVPRRRA